MQNISILWPKGPAAMSGGFTDCADDLELGRLCSLIFTSMPMAEALDYAMGLLTQDQEVISARHALIQDLVDAPELIDALEQVTAIISDIRFYSAGVRDNVKGLTGGDVVFDSMKNFIDGLEKLLSKNSGSMFEDQEPNNYYAQFLRATIFTYHNIKAYHQALSILKDALENHDCKSQGLRDLKAWVEETWKSDKLDHTAKKLAEVDSWWTGIASFAVDAGISANMDLQSFEISEINSTPYSKTGMLDRGAEEGYDGLTTLFNMPQGGSTVLYQEYLLSELGISAKSELTKLRSAVIGLPLNGRLQLIDLGDELPFITAAARLALSLKEKGLPVCRPEFSTGPVQDVKGVYMVELALMSENAVANDIYLGSDGAANIITGANSSGKTTYIITAGQLQWLFQLGCHLPAEKATMRPVDAVYTLFAAGESETGEDSRMGLEVIRIGEFKKKMTSRSMVLLNEPMTSTSAAEGIEICIDLLGDLMRAGVPSMMVTHYNEIYSLSLERFAPEGLDTKIKSYVMTIQQSGEEVTYTYKLQESPPGRSSHAYAVISKLGVTLDAMLESMTQAGLDMRTGDPAWQHLHPEA